jgi:hypothetical protein
MVAYPYWLSKLKIASFGGLGNLRTIKIDSSGNSYVVGYTAPPNPLSGLIAKIDTNGNLLWQKSLAAGSTIRARIYDLAIDSSTGDLYLVGTTNPGYQNALIVKLDSSGNLVWERQIAASRQNTAGDPGGYEEYGYSVAIGSSNILYVTGYTNTGAVSGTDVDAFIAQYTTTGTGTLNWLKTISSGTQYVDGKQVYVDSSNNAYVVGNNYTSSPRAAFVIKFNSSGTEVWQTGVTNGGTLLASSTMDSAGNLYLAGQTGIDNSTPTGFVCVVNSSGTVTSQWTGGTEWKTIAVDSNSDIYVGNWGQIVKFNKTTGTTAWQRVWSAVDSSAFFVSGIAATVAATPTGVYISGESTDVLIIGKTPVNGTLDGSLNADGLADVYAYTRQTTPAVTFATSSATFSDPGLYSRTNTGADYNDLIDSAPGLITVANVSLVYNVYPLTQAIVTTTTTTVAPTTTTTTTVAPTTTTTTAAPTSTTTTTSAPTSTTTTTAAPGVTTTTAAPTSTTTTTSAPTSTTTTTAAPGVTTTTAAPTSTTTTTRAPTSTTTTTSAPTITTTTTRAPTTTTTTTAAPITTTTTRSPTTTTTLAPGVKRLTIRNTGTGDVTVNSITFTDPLRIRHTADLSELGGSYTETGNPTLSYLLQAGETKTFTVNYIDNGAGAGTFYGTIVVNGSENAIASVNTTVIVS